MKSLLLLIFLVYTGIAIACDCSDPRFMEKYVRSDFVARITIDKTFPNLANKLHYQSTIIIHDLYKGNLVKAISIMGSSDGKRRTSCDVFFPKDTEMLVYAVENEDGQYIFDFCSGYRILKKNQPEMYSREIEMLNLLKQKGIKPTDKTTYGVDLGDRLKAFQGLKLTERFAIFEIIFSTDLQVDSIRTISSFTPELDESLMVILKQSRWVSSRNHFPDSPNRNKLLFAFYYYEAGKDYKSFIGEYDI